MEKEDKVKLLQFLIMGSIFCAGVFLWNVEAASLAAMVWVLWLIYSK